MEKEAYKLAFGSQFDNQKCDPDTVAKTIKDLYSRKGLMWEIILDYTTNLSKVFKNAVPFDERLTLNHNNVFNLNFPKLSCLYSLLVTLYFIGEMNNSDTSKV